MTDNIKTKKPKAKKPAQREKLEALAEEAEFVQRQHDEDAIHRSELKVGISNEEPELDLGDRIREAREAARLTQSELAELTKQADSEQKGVSRAVLSFYETGKSRPSPRELRMLCEVLRVSPSQLIYGIEDPFEQLMDNARYNGMATSDPEFFAMLVYAFSKQHHHIRLAIMQIMNSMLLGWDKTWTANTEEANLQFLEMADALRNVLAKREGKSPKKK